MILVKLMKLGIPVVEYSMEDGATVSDLFETADEEFKGTVTILDRPVDEDTALRDGDRVFVSAKVKGSTPLEVKLLRVGGATTKTYVVESGTSLGDFINGLEDKDDYIDASGNHKWTYTDVVGVVLSLGYTFSGTPEQVIRILLSKKTKGSR